MICIFDKIKRFFGFFYLPECVCLSWRYT